MPLRPAACLAVLLLAALLPRRVEAQDPIIKPTTTTVDRLPAPTPIVVKQLADGRIQVSWKRLSSANSYALWRSVPPTAVVALGERPTDTVYVDSDVKAGSWYYYNVAGVSEGGMIGMRAGGSLQATISAGATPAPTPAAGPTPPAPVEVRQQGLALITTWYATGSALSYDVSRIELASLSADSTRWDATTARVTRKTNISSQVRHELWDTVPSSPTSRWVQYRVTSNNILGSAGASASSTPRFVPGTANTTSTGTNTGTTTSPATFPAPTTVPAALGMTVAVGASMSLAERTGVTGAQWLSLDAGVASVGADGTVTGRAAGTTSVAALARQSDGSVRVMVVRVVVQ